MKKKIVSLLLAAVFVMSTCLQAAATPGYMFKLAEEPGLVPATEVLFYENFSDGVGQTEGSVWGSGMNTLRVLKNETTISTDEKYLSVSGTIKEAKSLILKKDSAIKGKFSVEFDFKTFDKDLTSILFGAGYTDGELQTNAIEIGAEEWVVDDRFHRNLFYVDKNGERKPLIDQTSSWRTLMDLHKWFLFYGDGGDWAPYSRDWFILKVDIDTDKETYSVYFNGSLCIKNEPFKDSSLDWSETGINLPFMSTVNDTDAVKYDNIKIYREPEGRTTFYANDFNNYPTELSWNGATSYATQRKSLFAGIAGLGLANMQNKGGYIYARNNALVTEYRNGCGGAFATGIRMDDDMTIDMDFTVSDFAEDSYLDNYATIIAMTPVGADGIRFSVSKDGKFIFYYYNRTIPYEPTILTNITLDEPHHLTIYMDFDSYTCDVYIDGVMIDSDRQLMFNMAKKGTSGYYKNGEDMTLAFGYHKESPTTDVTYDNLMLYRDKREGIFSDIASELSVRFSGTSVVKGNVQLPSGIDGYSVKWKSNSNIIKIADDESSATVNPTQEEQVVRLTAYASDVSGEYTAERSFDVVVAADDSITDISSLTDWTVVSGSPVLADNPTNEADKTVKITENSEAYITLEAAEGKTQTDVQLYTDREFSGSIYLADDDGNKLATVNLDKSLIQNSSYPVKNWFDLKITADMLKRTYDLFIDGRKVNNAPVSFEYTDEYTDSATLARVGFIGKEGGLYVNDVTSGTISENKGIEVRRIVYLNSDGEEINAPVKNASVSYAEIASTINQPVAVFVAVYDNEGRMLDIGKADIEAVTKEITKATVSGVDLTEKFKDGYEVKVYVWNDSAKIEALTDTHGKKLLPTIYIAGDSTAASYGAELYPYKGWADSLGDYLDEKVNTVNMAVKDCDTADFISEGYLENTAKQLQPGDYLLVQAGYDDAAAGVSVTDYKSNLKAISDKAKGNGATVIFVTPISESADLTAYIAAMKEVASAEGIKLLDLNLVWEDFMDASQNDASYYGKNIDAFTTTAKEWEVSYLNPDNEAYSALLTAKDGRLSPFGAQKAAELVSVLLSDEALLSSHIKSVEKFTYSINGSELIINGSGKMPVYADFSKTPWANENVSTVKIQEGITSISADALSGFENLKEVYIPGSVEVIQTGAFPENGEFTLYGENNTAAQRLSETDSDYDFAFKTFRILAIGNSHTHDYMNWRDLIFADLKEAGLKTEIVFDYALVGGAQLYYKDIGYVGVEGEFRSHYVQGSNSNRAYYNTYSKLRDNTYDLVLVQDYRESVFDKYRYTFATDITKVVRWIKNEQPNADVAWVADWTDMNSAGARDKLYNQWAANSVEVMKAVSSFGEDAPDFVVPMSTALQNARTSYLGGVYNDKDCYGDNSNKDWNGTNGIEKFTILERDGTHCSYELGRYLVSAAVFGKVFDTYRNDFDGFSFDFFDALKTTPEYVTNDIYPWNGEITENHLSIVRECGRNAISTPFEVVPSAYTSDPADAIAESIASLSYKALTKAEIVATVNSANLGVTITENDVTADGDSVVITFLYGYTKKTVNIR